ncbi:Rrf2 family transcriptional regulator [Acuticoccus sp. MNP-M23]|uniref:Rrf2 family transcriptional regulator n=1 Tax=Acuticoccus sp. MNP-M23 TaxID=3072793 RepID=UPI0028166A04|nr:Rrf2 family transcriptional regulator [Acuticoccus sp. MNP-M23]WMS41060.1 Rrf2 family transcriptional regulator [Acuticoccus sp. MNP-M23]
MKCDSRLSSVLHAVLHMADHDGPMRSEEIARCMNTNPVVVRRTMGFLREAGFVRSQKGHAGGWTISANLADITLRQLHVALGEPAVFAIGNRTENPACLVEQSVNTLIDETLGEVEALLLARFASVTLDDLAAEFRQRQAHWRRTNEDSR